jgi:phospholipase/carboxylesterase
MDLHYVTRPPLAGGQGPHPALVLLHGRGANEADLLPLVDDLDPRFFVVSARAPLPLGPGFAWYHLQEIGSPEMTTFGASLDALARLVEALPRLVPIDPSRLFTLGFSQGAMMAGSLLRRRPEAVAGTVMLSGYLPLEADLTVDEAKLAGRPIFVAHGTLDPVLPIPFGRAARDYFDSVGADLTYHEYPIAHYIASDELADVAGWLARRL